MPDANPNRAYLNARANLKDTAKWIVTVFGATIVLVIGGGVIAKIADLDWIHTSVAAGSLLVLMIACLIPLRAAIDIVAAKLVSIETIAQSEDYAATRAFVNPWLNYRPPIATVENLYTESRRQTQIANDPTSTPVDQQKANQALDALQPRIREVIEISNTEFRRLKFESLVRVTKCVLFVIVPTLFVFLVSTHRDDQMEKPLAKPIPIRIAWSADTDSALKKAGLDEKCYAPSRPQLLQLSEKSGMRAGVLVVPRNLGPECPAVRIIVTNNNEVYPDN